MIFLLIAIFVTLAFLTLFIILSLNQIKIKLLQSEDIKNDKMYDKVEKILKYE